MFSQRALRRMAGLFAFGGVAVSLAGLLVGVGLVVAPESAVSLPGYTERWWLWAIPLGGLALSVAAAVQGVKGRPVLVPRAWHKGGRHLLTKSPLDRAMALLTLVLLPLPLIALSAFETLGPHVAFQSPGARAASWATATIALGSTALPLVGLSIAAFHEWWWQEQQALSTIPSACRHCGYGFAGIGRGEGRRRCPECGKKREG